MGTVYRAEHRLMKRWVAIKVVRHALLEKQAVRERFLSELRTAARLAHPNIVVAHDAEEAGNLCFLVMEYVAGEDLAALVRRRGPLPVAEACHYVREAALGLQHAHENGLVHRDIKPGNLMLTSEGRVKVLDFGLARFTLEKAAEQTSSDLPSPPVALLAVSTVSQVPEQTATGSLLGTPAYMAPEQARDARSADIRSDIYSLGCTLVHLLTGQPNPTALSELRPPLPPELTAVLKRMLAENPAERFQTPAETAGALAPFAYVLVRQRARFLARKWLLLFIAIGMVFGLGLMVVLAIYFPRNSEQSPGTKREGINPGEYPQEDPRAPTRIINLIARPSVTLEGTSVQVTLRVLPQPPNVGEPDGQVTIRSGEEVLGTGKLQDGKATVTIMAPNVGQHPLTAVYAGDEAYAPCTSEPITLRVGIGAIQQFTVTGAKTGMITLSFNGVTTVPMRCDVDARQVESALNNLSRIGGVEGQVVVRKVANVYTVTFIGSLGAKKVPQITATGRNGASVSTATLRQGAKP